MTDKEKLEELLAKANIDYFYTPGGVVTNIELTGQSYYDFTFDKEGNIIQDDK